MDYQNGLPEWTLICAIEYFLCVFGTEWPRVASEGDLSEKYAVYVPQNLALYVRAITGSEVIAQVTVTVPSPLYSTFWLY